jgi:serine/threonine-protein kinase
MSATMNRLALVCVPLAATGLLACAALPAVQGQDGAPEAKRQQELAARAREILKQNCFACHADKPDEVEADLNLLDRAALEKGKIVVPGKPDASLLVKRITSTRRPMPPKPKTPLSPADVEVLKDWISAGAPALTNQVVAEKGPALVDIPVEAAKPGPGDVRTIFKKNCAQCHGGAEPEQFTIDNRQQLVAKGVVVPGQPDDSSLFQRITAQGPKRMPPESDGRPALTPDQVAAVRAWIQQGAPPLDPFVLAPPNQVGDDYVLRAILQDVQRLTAANERLESYRYFSLNHLLAGGITQAELDFNRQAFTLVVNHLTRKQGFTVPQPIEPTGTVFRLDISRLGWDQAPYVKKEDGKDVAADFTLYDLLLLDYPYGLIYDGSPAYRQLVTQFLTPTHQVRPVAFLRADWLVNTAARPPLYHDMLQLPFNFFNNDAKGIGGLEKQLALDTRGDIDRDRVLRAGFTLSGVSRNNRIVERHAPDNTGYLWLSYDYRGNTGTDNIYQDPVHLNPTGGEMIFRLPNGMQGYYVATGKGTRLDVAPTEIVTDRFAADQAVRTGLACMRCHPAGMRTFHDNVRSIVEQLASSPTAFERDEALRLYPRQAQMDHQVALDQQAYLGAVRQLFDLKPNQPVPPIDQMLDRVSKRYLDEPLNVQAAATELGVTKPEAIQQAFQTRQLAAAGLIPLASGGSVRRDTWEDLFDQAAEALNRGIPVVPVDGLTRPEYQRPDAKATFVPTASRRTLKEGDVLVLSIKNTSEVPIFVEAVATGTKGRKAFLTADVTSIAAGATLKKAFKIDAVTGKEAITVYGCDRKFEKGEILAYPRADVQRGFDMTDRLVHRQFYRLPENGGRLRPEFDATRVVKKTIEIETQ